jgi:hypothetical protein
MASPPPGYRVQDKKYRAWINAPSTLQSFHRWHGKAGIIFDDDGGLYVMIYFVDGPIFSSWIPRSTISKYDYGHPNHSYNNLERIDE